MPKICCAIKDLIQLNICLCLLILVRDADCFGKLSLYNTTSYSPSTMGMLETFILLILWKQFFLPPKSRNISESSISIRLCLFLCPFFLEFLLSFLFLSSTVAVEVSSFAFLSSIFFYFTLLFPLHTQTSLYILSRFFFSYHLLCLSPTSPPPLSSIYHPFPFHNLAFLQSIIHQCQRLGCFLEDLSCPWSYITRAVSPSPPSRALALPLSLSACSNVFKQWDAFLQISFRKIFLVKNLCLKQQFRALKTENERKKSD